MIGLQGRLIVVGFAGGFVEVDVVGKEVVVVVVDVVGNEVVVVVVVVVDVGIGEAVVVVVAVTWCKMQMAIPFSHSQFASVGVI